MRLRLILVLFIAFLAVGWNVAQAMKTDTLTTEAAVAQVPDKAGSNGQVMSEGPRITVLENGLTVLTYTDKRFPLVSTRLYVHAGSAYEDPKQAGISHLLEHMVFKGTAKRAPGEVARDVESVGGSLNAATSFDYTVYYVDVPAPQWQLSLDVIHDMIFNATIDPKELESEKQVVLAELERGEDNPNSILFKSMQEQVWPNSSYAWPIIGYRDTVSNASSRDIHEYIDKMYQPQSMLLVVVGDMDDETVLAEARKLYGGLQNTRDLSPPQEIPFVADAAGPKVRVRHGKWNKVYMSVAFPVPGLRSDEAASLEVLAHLLGGDRTSTLYRHFKYEKRMVDDIWAGSYNLERGGMFLVQATLDEENAQAYFNELLAMLASLKAQDFTDEHLSRTMLNLEDSMFRTKETLAGLASKMGYFQFFEHDIKAEENYLYTIRGTSRSQLQEMIDEYVRPERLCVGIIAPENATITEADLKDGIRSAWKGKMQVSEVAEQGVRGNTEIVELGNGARLVLRPDTILPYAAVSIAWPGGGTLVEQKKQGLPSVTASVLSRGTSTLNATAIQDFLSERASNFGASAQRDSFSVSARFPARFSKDMLGLVEDALVQGVFDSEELDRAKEEQLANIKKREDQPLGTAFRNTFPFLFNGPGYGWFHLGTKESVETFTRDDAVAFWKLQRSRPFVMSVCGDYDRDAIVTFARNLASAFEVKPLDGPAFSAPSWNEPGTLDLKLEDRKQSHLMLIYPVVGLENEDTASLKLLRDILAGMSGLLFRDLRDKQGLGYTVTSFLWQVPDGGFMAFYIGTDPDREDEALKGFHKAIANLRENLLPQEELDRAANILEGDYYRDHQSIGSRASEASSLLLKNLPLDNARKNIEKARKLTPEDIRTLARKYFVNGKEYLVRVTP